jgi:hypothetical protein
VVVLVATTTGCRAPEGAVWRSLGRGTPPEPVCPFTSRMRPALSALTTEDDPVDLPRKRAWEESHGGKEAARPFVRARLAGVPAGTIVDGRSLPRDDRAFLVRVAADTWRGLVALADRESGLPVDHVRLDGNGRDGPDVGDYTNITNVGLRLLAIAAASDLGLVTPDDARAMVARLLATLDGLETYRGLFFNYYDTTSLERSSNFLSFVDTSWLTAGLIATRTTFPELAAHCTTLIDRMRYDLFYDRKRRAISHGYFVHRRAPSRYDYGVLYTEARLGALLAIGKGDMPEDAWFAMIRTYPASCAGQSGTPVDVAQRRIRGHTVVNGHYSWEGTTFVPSWGGSMFEALMPALVLDEARLAPRSLGPNDVLHADVQRRYATGTLHYPVWGMSPSAIPDQEGYREYGVPPLGARGYMPGAVTPHAAALALLVTPGPAIANLRALAEGFAVYADYGYYDAVDPRTGAVARAYLALDQSMLFLALADHLAPHGLRERFATDPVVQRVLPLLADERFFD